MDKVNSNVIEGNKLIAEFMGFDGWQEKGHFNEYGYYDSSWDWLMPVALKVKTYFVPEQKTAWQQDVLETKAMKLWETTAYALACINIEMVFKSVLEFIKWHNNNQK